MIEIIVLIFTSFFLLTAILATGNFYFRTQVVANKGSVQGSGRTVQFLPMAISWALFFAGLSLMLGYGNII